MARSVSTMINLNIDDLTYRHERLRRFLYMCGLKCMADAQDRRVTTSSIPTSTFRKSVQVVEALRISSVGKNEKISRKSR
jgi:hypothetical protein